MKTTELKQTVLLGGACLLSALLVSTASFADDASPDDPDECVEVTLAEVEAVRNLKAPVEITEIEALDNGKAPAEITEVEALDNGKAPAEITFENWTDEVAIGKVIEISFDLEDDAFNTAKNTIDESARASEAGAEFTIGYDIVEAGKSSSQMTQDECLWMFPQNEKLCATFE
jgi:hypothetical protein